MVWSLGIKVHGCSNCWLVVLLYVCWSCIVVVPLSCVVCCQAYVGLYISAYIPLSFTVNISLWLGAMACSDSECSMHRDRLQLQMGDGSVKAVGSLGSTTPLGHTTKSPRRCESMPRCSFRSG